MTARLICLFLFCPSAAMGASLTLSEIISRGLEFSPEVKKAVVKAIWRLKSIFTALQSIEIM